MPAATSSASLMASCAKGAPFAFRLVNAYFLRSSSPKVMSCLLLGISGIICLRNAHDAGKNGIRIASTRTNRLYHVSPRPGSWEAPPRFCLGGHSNYFFTSHLLMYTSSRCASCSEQSVSLVAVRFRLVFQEWDSAHS